MTVVPILAEVRDVLCGNLGLAPGGTLTPLHLGNGSLTINYLDMIREGVFPGYPTCDEQLRIIKTWQAGRREAIILEQLPPDEERDNQNTSQILRENDTRQPPRISRGVLGPTAVHLHSETPVGAEPASLRFPFPTIGVTYACDEAKRAAETIHALGLPNSWPSNLGEKVFFLIRGKFLQYEPHQRRWILQVGWQPYQSVGFHQRVLPGKEMQLTFVLSRLCKIYLGESMSVQGG